MGGRRAAIPRHRTLRATLDWSYEILPEREQEVLRSLSVFRGSFTLEGADAVAALDAVDLVHSLVSKSLIVVDAIGRSPRLRLLDSTRAYALEKLQQAGEFDAVARRHAVYLRDHLQRLEPSWSSPAPAEDRTVQALQVDNIRAAMAWAFSPHGDGSLGVALTVAAAPFFMHFSLVDECAASIERVLTGDLAAYPRTKRQELKLLVDLAAALLLLTRWGPELSSARLRAYELATELDDTEYRLRTVMGLWTNSYMFGDLAGALRAAEQFTRLAPSDTAEADLLIGERLLGLTRHLMGDQTAALQHLDYMLERYVAPPDRSHLLRYQFDQKVAARCFRSVVMLVRGYPEQALELVESYLVEATSTEHLPTMFYAFVFGAGPVSILIGDKRLVRRFVQQMFDTAVTPAWTLWAECFKGTLLIQEGNPDGPTHLRHALDGMAKTTFQKQFAWFLGVLALGLLNQSQFEQAESEIQRALDISEQRKERWFEPELLRIKAEIGAAQGRLEEARALLQESLALAHEQGALAWELRTAISMVKLPGSRDDAVAALDTLAEIYARFTEGFGFPDLVEAHALLGRPAQLPPVARDASR